MTHSLTLSNGAASVLAQLASAPGMLADAANLYRVGAFAEDHLTDLPESPAQPSKDAAAAEWRAWQKAQVAWSRLTLPVISVNEKTRDSLKALVQAAVTKGALPASAAVAPLLRSLGLADVDVVSPAG